MNNYFYLIIFILLVSLVVAIKNSYDINKNIQLKRKKRKIESKFTNNVSDKKDNVSDKKDNVSDKKDNVSDKKDNVSETINKQNITTFNNIIYWKDKLLSWKNGKDLPDIKDNIFLECSAIQFDKNGWGIYYENQIKDDKKSILTTPNFTNFKTYMKKNECVSFPNLDKSCLLIIPPDKTKNYANIHLFYKNATHKEKKELWKKVSDTVYENQKFNKKLWVSTHGSGVAWLHIRLCKKPTYYHQESLDLFNTYLK